MTGQELIPRATVEEIVRYRDNAIELYKDAFSFIEEAAAAIKAAEDMAALASGGVSVYVNSRENGCNEIEDFEKAVQLPQRDLYEGVARRLTDLRVWSWVVQRTEPSAGTGNLARPCATAGYRRGQHSSPADSYDYAHKVDCIEVQPELARALRAEGIYNNVMCSDFLQVRPRPDYDLIVMNPPFDLERDIDHVMHAWKFLKPTGTLIAIMSAGTEFRETRKAKAFREIFKLGHRSWCDLPANSFSEVGTNVNTCLLKVRKDGKERS